MARAPKVAGKRRTVRGRDRRSVKRAATPAPLADVPVAAESAVDEEPVRDPLATTWTELDLFCRHCQITLHVPTCVFLNAADSPALVVALKAGHFNLKFCPLCERL